MGILNKILFWRHDDEMDFDALAEKPLHGKDSLGLDMPDFDEKSPFPDQQDLRPSSMQRSTPASPYKQTNYQPALSPASENIEKDLELISSKLDTIKVMLSSLDQRTANLERAAGVQQQRRERLW
jgi:hypothetical protein